MEPLLRPLSIQLFGTQHALGNDRGVAIRINEKGVPILLVEQNARLAMKFADYLYVLKYGRVVMEGPRAEFENSTALVDAYLGV